MEGQTYEAAGVSLATAGAVVERLRAAVESTGAKGFGAFAGLHPLDERRLLAASTDGVGTKLILARERGALRACGADLAAHCINDVITTGADPLFLLDYVAANRIELEQVAELVEGMAEVCRAAGCALLGGETAELPGIYRDDELDFAGTCVGVVERDRVIDGSAVDAGDVVIGLPSAGVHANGFTLVRQILEREDYDGDDLLAPTRLYLDDVRRLREHAHALRARHRRRDRGQPAPRIPDGLELRASTGTPGSARRSSSGSPGTSTSKSCAACSTSASATARSSPRRHRRPRDRARRVIGVLVSGEGSNLQALIDEGLPIAAVASNRSDARCARAGGSRRHPVGGLPARPATRAARSATPRWPTGSPSTASLGRARGLHAPAAAVVSRPVSRARDQRASALLPRFPGTHAIEDALAAGVQETGATVHYVDEGVDTGPVIVQERVSVQEGDTVDTLRARIQAVEHQLLPRGGEGTLCAR